MKTSYLYHDKTDFKLYEILDEKTNNFAFELTYTSELTQGSGVLHKARRESMNNLPPYQRADDRANDSLETHAPCKYYEPARRRNRPSVKELLQRKKL